MKLHNLYIRIKIHQNYLKVRRLTKGFETNMKIFIKILIIKRLLKDSKLERNRI